MRVVRLTIYANAVILRVTLFENGLVYINDVRHPLSTWSHDVEDFIAATYSWNPDVRGYRHVFKMVDYETRMYHLVTRDGYDIPNSNHRHRVILVMVPPQMRWTTVREEEEAGVSLRTGPFRNEEATDVCSRTGL